MLLHLAKNLADRELAPVLALAAEFGLDARFLDEGRTLLELRGAADPRARSRFEDLAAVRQVLDSSDQPERSQATAERPASEVALGEARFGAGKLSLVAGPCAVEDPVRLLEIARAVQRAGATVLRGGAFKPRTSPHAFQGLGRAALEMLAEARRVTGLAVLTEVLDPRDVAEVAEVADAFQIGSRSMSNAALLAEVGRAGKPVVLKRGLAATVREFLLAAEYVLNQGNEAVILCERGVRSFDSATRNLLDVGAVAYLKGATHLPVIVDPSHAAGRADLVRPLARAGLAAGADGLIVEVHPAPHEVHSDGAQALSPAAFADLARDAAALAALDGRTLIRPEPAPLLA